MAVAGTVQRKTTDTTMASSLEIAPSELIFEPTEVGKWSIRHVTMTNRGEKTVQVASIIGPATVAQHPPTVRGFGDLSVPTAPWPRMYDVVRAVSGPFETFYHDEIFYGEIRSGATAEYQVNFSPTAEGHAQSSFTFLNLDRRSLGTILVSGDGKKPEKETGEYAKTKHPNYPIKTSGNRLVDKAKLATMDALVTWTQTADRSLEHYRISLLGEWADYLGKTASNPTISSASLPGGPSMLAHLAEHTIASLAAKGAEHVIEHTAEHMAEHAAVRAVGAAGAGAAGAEAGSLAGPAGAAIGFVVGVLIETVAGDLFESLTSEDAEVRKALQEEFQRGVKTGAKTVAELMKRKIGEELKAQDKAKSYQEGMENRYRKLVLGATDAKRVDYLHAEIEAQTDLAADATPTTGFSRGLLEMWARDHAGTGTKEVPGDQLAEVSEEVRYALEQPDLFVTQCLHEWRKRGLPVTREFEATMRTELSHHGVHELTTSSSESSKNREQAMALSAQKLFNGREFVWKDVKELKGFNSDRAMSQLRPNDVRHGVRIEGGDVYCAPILVVDGASCSVLRFDYRVKNGGLTLGASSSPGDSSFQAYGAATATGEDAGIAIYDLMRKLRGYGVTIVQKPDALHNPWLQRTFGANTAIPKLQHTDGQQSRVAVFEGAELLDPQSGGGVVPDSLFQMLASTGVAGPGNNLMIRGGDTILVLHGEWK